MSWYNEAIFYHIYPLGLTGAPKQNENRVSLSIKALMEDNETLDAE